MKRYLTEKVPVERWWILVAWVYLILTALANLFGFIDAIRGV